MGEVILVVNFSIINVMIIIHIIITIIPLLLFLLLCHPWASYLCSMYVKAELWTNIFYPFYGSNAHLSRKQDVPIFCSQHLVLPFSAAVVCSWFMKICGNVPLA